MQVWCNFVTDNFVKTEVQDRLLGSAIRITLNPKETFLKNFDSPVAWMAMRNVNTTPDGDMSKDIADGLHIGCFLIHEGTVLEWEATPEGVGISENDMILMVDHSYFAKATFDSKEMDNLSYNFKRTIKKTSTLKLGLPYVSILGDCLRGHTDEDAKESCMIILKCIEILLIKSFDRVLANFKPSRSRFQQPNLSELKSKLRTNVYEHSYQCIIDLQLFLHKWQKYANSFKIALPFFKKLGSVYNNFCTHFIKDWNKKEDNGLIKTSNYRVLVIGPVRDSTLQGGANSKALDNDLSLILPEDCNITLQNLMDNYNAYKSRDIKEPLDDSKADFANFSLNKSTDEKHEENIQCLIKKVFQVQKYIGIPQYFHIRFQFKKSSPQDRAISSKDDDLNELLRYIEGDEEKEIKDKKKKKKTCSINNANKEQLTFNSTEKKSDSNEKSLRAETKDITEGAEAPSPEAVIVIEGSDEEVDDADFTVYTNRRRSKARRTVPNTFYITTKKPMELVKTKINKTALKAEHSSGFTAEPKQASSERAMDSKSFKNISVELNQKCKIEEELLLRQEELAKIEGSAKRLILQSTDMLMGLQKKLEDSENRLHTNEKQCSQLDADIENLEKQKRDIVAKNSKLAEEREKIRQIRIAREHEVDMKLESLKHYKSSKIQDVKSLKDKLTLSKIEMESNKTIQTIQTPKVAMESNHDGKSDIMKLLQQQLKHKEVELLQEQIKEMESKLECPVCLEVSQIPIYMCQELHIICSICWTKVIRSCSDCVLCRTPYPNSPRRHRYMEDLVEKLATLRKRCTDLNID